MKKKSGKSCLFGTDMDLVGFNFHGTEELISHRNWWENGMRNRMKHLQIYQGLPVWRMTFICKRVNNNFLTMLLNASVAFSSYPNKKNLSINNQSWQQS